MSTERDTSGVWALLLPRVNPRNTKHCNMYSKDNTYLTEYCNMYSKDNPYLTNKLTLHPRRDLASWEYCSRYQINTDT
jgi:hypothetical protein